MPILYPIARKALFALSAETAHELVLGGLALLPSSGRWILRRRYEVRDDRLRTSVFGIDFANPVGLAAGLDKRGIAFNSLAAFGFGFIEIGTITAHAQPGNPRPRLFRLPRDRALLNRMGFNNPGAAAVAQRLAGDEIETVLGINIGKSKVAPNERAIEDYLVSLDALHAFADYLVVNVSSPNTPGLRELQEAEPLRELLTAVVGRTRSGGRRRVPVLVKIAPDLTDQQLDQAVDIAIETGAAGIVAVNTTIGRTGLETPAAAIESYGAGGISGAPLRARAQELVRRIFERTLGQLPIVGVGGIFSAEDAWQRIRAGASLVQIYTGMIYDGPGIVAQVNRGILDRLERHGFATLGEAVGTGDR